MSRSHGSPSFTLAACALAFVALAGCDSHDPVVVAPQDTVPPAAPQALYSVTGDGTVALDWVKNTERALAGARVFVGRGCPGPYNTMRPRGARRWSCGTSIRPARKMATRVRRAA